MSLCVASWRLFRLNFLFLSMLLLSSSTKNTCFGHPKKGRRWFDLPGKEINFGRHKISWRWSDCPWELASFGHNKIRWRYSWVSTKKTNPPVLSPGKQLEMVPVSRFDRHKNGCKCPHRLKPRSPVLQPYVTPPGDRPRLIRMSTLDISVVCRIVNC